MDWGKSIEKKSGAKLDQNRRKEECSREGNANGSWWTKEMLHCAHIFYIYYFVHVCLYA